jgi:hypothetical protein
MTRLRLSILFLAVLTTSLVVPAQTSDNVSAIEVARKIYFIPAFKDGRFVSTALELKYFFNIY